MSTCRWRAQITFAIIRLVFALSAFPFLLFAIGPLAKLFSHVEPTAYTADGRIVHTDTCGLSAYLAWLRTDVLETARFVSELEEDFADKDVTRLRKALKEGEQTLATAWKRPHSARQVMRQDEI